MNVPALDVITKAPRNASEIEIQKLRERELRRGGLILRDPAVVEAMECGDTKRYLPVKYTKDGALSGDVLVEPKQVEQLSAHVEHMMERATAEILGGVINCNPYYKGPSDNACIYCEYAAVCGFDEELGDKRRLHWKLAPDEVWERISQAGKTGCDISG